MDPTIMIVVTALALGAAAGLRPVTEQAIKDAYAGLKKLIQDRYAKARLAVDLLESDPTQDAYKQAASQALSKSGTAQDSEVIQQAQAFLKLVKEHAPDTAGDIGITIHEIDVMTDIKFEKLVATGNIKLDLAKVTSKERGFSITDLHAGSTGTQEENRPKV